MITRVNIKDKPTPKYDLYIGRTNSWLGLEGSKWANPFVLKKESERQQVVSDYEQYVRSRPDLIDALSELKDLVLGCYCTKDKTCHGDVLIKLYKEFINEQ